ncbi:hypothetical protein L211DRAFT_443734 [Terfezia boudieri ATCC MYA-4762]|uniref:Uncharacterized protein n=1 Tax=Terfezia boudieri ATCC MYA-4762 TaxID=1051890 RepID=A0A3N4LEN3_9PEZI|nr:hypothetical protein L211DRAFT_443734 [Terfezia boudieri ATCC MYA-4762]
MSVCTTASELRFLGEDLSDQKIKWQILGNLLPEYNALVTTLSNIDTPTTPMTVAAIREAILREERQILLKKNPKQLTIPNLSLSTSFISQAQQNTALSKCPTCGRKSHTEKECWHKYPQKGTTQ